MDFLALRYRLRLNDASTTTEDDLNRMEQDANEFGETLAGLQPPLTSTNPKWAATVYFDSAKFPVVASLERIERHYAEAFPGRAFRLERVADLSRAAITKYPLAEELLRRRGFVSDIEVTAFAKKDHHAETSYLARNKAATYYQFAVIDHLVQPTKIVKEKQKLRNPRSAMPPKRKPKDKKKSLVERWRADRDGLIGQQNHAPSPLVERDGLLLPCHQFWQVEQIHFAHAWKPKLALAHGDNDPAGLGSAMPDELRAQLRFERRHSRALFNGASATALLLWQTQALALLRKATWQIEFTLGPFLNRAENTMETGKARALGTLRRKLWRRRPRRIVVASADGRSDYAEARLRKAVGLAMSQSARERDVLCLSVQMQAAVQVAKRKIPDKNAFEKAIDALGKSCNLERRYASERRRALTLYGSHDQNAEYTYGLTTEQVVAAALHGATYRPQADADDKTDVTNPIHWLQPVAEWIGELKRQRNALLTTRIAELLSDIFVGDNAKDPDDPQLSLYAKLIKDRLGRPAWQVIETAAVELLESDSAEPIPVVYDWTRDADRPWDGERRADGTIVLRGPLLDFPVSQAAYWNETCQVLREEGGLRFQRERPKKEELVPAV